MGHSDGVRRAYLDGNWTGQGGKRIITQQNDSYPGNEAKCRT